MTSIPSPLVFTYQDGELARVRKEARRSYARAADGFSLWALVVSMIFVIGLAVLGAQKAGMLTAANVPPVLLAAYLAYAGGVALMVLVSRIYQRQLERAATAGQVESERQIAISDAGIVAKSANHDLRVTWHAVRSIDVRPDVVLIWLEWYQFIAVPARAFADEAARVAFVTAVRDWIKTARREQA